MHISVYVLYYRINLLMCIIGPYAGLSVPSTEYYSLLHLHRRNKVVTLP